ncbi:hypothetical protein Tco_1474150 [Tanacetum coccineum]
MERYIPSFARRQNMVLEDGDEERDATRPPTVGIKSLLNAASITAVLIDVNAAQSKLVLLENFNENYSKCLRLLYKVNAAERVNAASEEVSTVELVSTAYLKEFDLLKWDQQVVSELVPLRNFARRYGSRFCTHGGCIQSSHAQTGLQKLVSQLEILDKKLSQEDVNQKLLRSLSPEWNTHAVVWRNKAELETMSLDDLYNHLKVYEREVKGMSSSISNTQNMAFVSSLNNNTNEAVNTAHGVSTASTQVNVVYSTNIDNLSDAVICSFFASQPNSPELEHEDLQ